MSSQTLVALADGREVLLSYGVPVAAFIPGRGFVRVETRYSVTTSRHANTYAGRDSDVLPSGEFATLIAPVQSGRVRRL